MQRYTRVYTLPPRQYVAGAPLLIEAGALLKDNETGDILAQLKFRSITEKTISAVRVSLSAFDVEGAELQTREDFRYLDLTVSRDDFFGEDVPITMPDRMTRRFSCNIERVIFSDGSAWAGDAAWHPLGEQVPLRDQLGELTEQYRRETYTGAKFVPVEAEGIWLCTCGAVNTDADAACRSCRVDRQVQFDALSSAYLDARYAEYQEAEAKRREADAAAREKAQFEAAQRAQKAKRKKGIIVAVAVLLIAAIIAVVVWSGQKKEAKQAEVEAYLYEEIPPQIDQIITPALESEFTDEQLDAFIESGELTIRTLEVDGDTYASEFVHRYTDGIYYYYIEMRVDGNLKTGDATLTPLKDVYNEPVQ